MDEKALYTQREKLIALADKGKSGNNSAIDELLVFALKGLVEEYNRNVTKGRKIDKSKQDRTLELITIVAINQINAFGKVVFRDIVSSVMVLARKEKLSISDRTVREVIRKNKVQMLINANIEALNDVSDT